MICRTCLNRRLKSNGHFTRWECKVKRIAWYSFDWKKTTRGDKMPEKCNEFLNATPEEEIQNVSE